MHQLLIGLFLLPIPVQAVETPVTPVYQATEPVKELTIDEKIMLTFNNPRMLKVAYCESGKKQFVGSTTQPIISRTSDVGLMQINQVHWKQAKELGLDIFNSVDDNLKMAKIIYDMQGINAWVCNKLVPKDV